MFYFGAFFLVLSSSVVLADFPDGVTKCHRGDNACFANATQEVLNTFYDGLPDLNLIRVDPLQVDSLVLERNPSSPVNIELKFEKLEVIGLKNGQVKRIEGINFEERSVLELFVPEILLRGNYSSDGHVLILPITGKGQCVITCKNILFEYSFDLKPIEKNGQVYATLEHVKLKFKPELVQFHFDGLFNGNMLLGDSTNRFLNENWREIYNELEGSFAKGLGLVTKIIINNVLSKYPYDFLLPE